MKQSKLPLPTSRVLSLPQVWVLSGAVVISSGAQECSCVYLLLVIALWGDEPVVSLTQSWWHHRSCQGLVQAAACVGLLVVWPVRDDVENVPWQASGGKWPALIERPRNQ